MNRRIKLASPPWVTGRERDLVNLDDDPDYTGEKPKHDSSNNLADKANLGSDQTITQALPTVYDLDQTKVIPEHVQREIGDMTLSMDELKQRFIGLVQKIYQS